MSVASEAVKRLVQWAPEAAASADDLARFGPQAARVRALLDFLPTMSDEARSVANLSDNLPYEKFSKYFDEIHSPAWDRGLTATNLRNNELKRDDWDAVRAVIAEGVSDVISPEAYAALTTPIESGRAVDMLRNRARLQNTPFTDVVQQMGMSGAVSRPRDVVVGSRIAQAPEDIREIALTLIADGMPAEEALRTARLL